MEVLMIPVFISICLLAAGIVFLLRGIKGGDYEHGDRLTLLPLDEDVTEESQSAPAVTGREE